jgi:hypothetical protein
MGTLHRMIDSNEDRQAWRYRWIELDGRFYVYDSTDLNTANHVDMGEPWELFCDEHGENCLMPGTQRFYDALNMYFEHEQAEVERTYLGLEPIEEEERQIS